MSAMCGLCFSAWAGQSPHPEVATDGFRQAAKALFFVALAGCSEPPPETPSFTADFRAALFAEGSLGAEQAIFLPTKCLSLLETLCTARPNHCLLAADFDELPETSIPGKNAPLVASTVSPLQLALKTIARPAHDGHHIAPQVRQL